ncbi:hypothetical protein SKAU_G00271960 [Synaphobranchus kaupii]|uniref:Uncharacterized protein n=1 Tax=Synaphobranchus kaupii TaxID=118154 RepID=A0A9Q1F0F6_SYNKA|nr:hypothetical protein SKAU_G00271960 [Synaphobranchus kaupii]
MLRESNPCKLRPQPCGSFPDGEGRARCSPRPTLPAPPRPAEMIALFFSRCLVVSSERAEKLEPRRADKRAAVA